MMMLCLLLAQLAFPSRPDTYPVDLRVTPTTTGARLRLAVLDPRRRTILRRFAIVGERPLHLFLVGAGLDFVARDAPVQQPDGVFMIDVTLPKPGPYMAMAEFQPEGAARQTFQQMFTTGEAFARLPAPVPDLAPKVVNGVRVRVDASQLRAGDRRPLLLQLDEAATGAPASDLQPSFGAPAHLLLVLVDLTEAIHAEAAAHDGDGSLTFTPLIPRAGRYKAWLQFQRGGTVSTVSFVIDVR